MGINRLKPGSVSSSLILNKSSNALVIVVNFSIQGIILAWGGVIGQLGDFRWVLRGEM